MCPVQWVQMTQSLPILQISTNIHPLFGPPFTPYNPSFSGLRKVRGDFIKSQYEMLKLSTKRWIPAFNAQGSRGIIVAVQVGAVKIYVTAVEVVRTKKKGRHGETHEPSKLMVFLSFNPGWMLMYFFAGFFFKNLTPMYDQTQGMYWCCLFLTLWISLLWYNDKLLKVATYLHQR